MENSMLFFLNFEGFPSVEPPVHSPSVPPSLPSTCCSVPQPRGRKNVLFIKFQHGLQSGLIHRPDKTGGEGCQHYTGNHFQHKTIKPKVQLEDCFLFLLVLKFLDQVLKTLDITIEEQIQFSINMSRRFITMKDYVKICQRIIHY